MEYGGTSSFDPPNNYSPFDSILMPSPGISCIESTEVSFDFPGHSPETVSKFEAINRETKTVSVSNGDTEQHLRHPITICSQPKDDLILDCISPSMLHKKTGQEPLKLDNEQLKAEADQAIDSELSNMHGGSRSQCYSPNSRQALLNDLFDIISRYLTNLTNKSPPDFKFPQEKCETTQHSQNLGTQSVPDMRSNSGNTITYVSNGYQVETPISSPLLEPIRGELKLSPTTHHNGQSSSPNNFIAPGPSSNVRSPLQVSDQFAGTQPSLQNRNDFNFAATTLQNGQGSSPYHNVTAVPTPSPYYSTPGSNSSASSIPDEKLNCTLNLTQSPYHSPYLEPLYGDLERTSGASIQSPVYSSSAVQNDMLPHYSDGFCEGIQKPSLESTYKPIQTTVSTSTPAIQQELSIKFTSPILSQMNVPIAQPVPKQPKASTSSATKKKDAAPRVPKKRGRRPKSAQLTDTNTPSTSSQPLVAVESSKNRVVSAVKPQQHSQGNLYPLTQYIEVQPTHARHVGFSHQQAEFSSAQHGMPRSQIVNARSMQTACSQSQNVLQPQNGGHISYQNSANANLLRPEPSQTPGMVIQDRVHYTTSMLLPRKVEGIGHSNQQMVTVPGQSHQQQIIMQQGTTQQTHNFPQPQRAPQIFSNQQGISNQQLYQPNFRNYQLLPQTAPQMQQIQRGHNTPAPVSRQAAATPQPGYQLSSATINQQQRPMYQQQHQSIIVNQQQQFQRMPTQQQQQFVHQQQQLLQQQQQPMMMNQQSPMMTNQQSPMMTQPLPIHQQQVIEVQPAIRKRRSQIELSGPPQQVPRLPTPAPGQQFSNTSHIIPNGNSPNSQNNIPLPGFGTFANRF